MVHIPKTAGGSIRRWFGSNVDGSKFQLVGGHNFIEGISKEHPNYEYSFAVVRNTYHRIISGYVFARYKQQQKFNKQSKRSFEQQNHVVFDHAKKMLAVFDKGIEYFVEYSQENASIISIPQTRWIQGVDHVFQHDNLNHDFKKIQKDVNCSIPLEKTHHVLKYNRQDYLNKKFIKVVEKYYENEIQYFNFKPD